MVSFGDGEKKKERDKSMRLERMNVTAAAYLLGTERERAFREREREDQL